MASQESNCINWDYDNIYVFLEGANKNKSLCDQGFRIDVSNSTMTWGFLCNLLLLTYNRMKVRGSLYAHTHTLISCTLLSFTYFPTLQLILDCLDDI